MPTLHLKTLIETAGNPYVRFRNPSSQGDSHSQSSNSTSLEELPFECLTRIIANINSPEDLESASAASPTLALVINDDLLWKQLTMRSYTPNQVLSVHCGRSGWSKPTDPERGSIGFGECNWRRAYIRLLRRYGEQQVYSASLGICENCQCLYWMVSCLFYT